MVTPAETVEAVAAEPMDAEVAEDSTQETPESEAPEGEASAEQSAQDWQKETEKLNSELAKVTQDLARKEQQLSSVMGSVRKQAEMEALIMRQGNALDALVEHLSDPDAMPESLKAKVATIKAQETAELANTRNQGIRDGWLAGINKMLRDSGIQGNDTRLEQAIALWNEGNSDERSPDLEKLHRAQMSVYDVVMAVKDESTNQKVAEATKQADTQRRRTNAENGTLAVGASGGTGMAGVSAQELVNRMASGASMTMDEMKRAGEAMDRGVYPKL